MPRAILPALLLALAGLAPVAASAQGLDQSAPAPGDADRLAAQMRILAANPTDLAALLAAGELSIKIDDLGAAASFFARAEKIDPHSGRAKAGEGAILVHAERPGEALRYFAQAEGYGLAPAAFAMERGLAYDLIGEQERAQRDYRLALHAGPDEETQRRYALSLAIAGKRELADQELQTLLRKSDRGAWRVHAFVLALAGNVAEAERIATTMMPPGTAAGLQPFLEKLPTLGPVDRAFAVHFGEVRSTPQRVADAKLAPPLAALGPDPYAPRVQVAAVADKSRKRDDKRKRGKREPVQVAVAIPAPEPLPQAPAYRPAAGTPPVLATRGAAPASWPTPITPETREARGAIAASRPATAPVILAASSARSVPPPETNVVVSTIGPAPTRATPPPPVASAPTPLASASAAPASEPGFSTAASAVSAPSPAPSPVTDTPAASPSTTSVASEPASIAHGSAPLAWTTAINPATPPPSPTVAPAAAVSTSRHDDSAVSRIVAGLPIPGSELGVAGSSPASAEPDPAMLAAKAAADKRAADKKAAAEKKALAEKKAAAARKADEAREEAARKKIERANPERIWVQVAGGANAHDLPKAWAGAKAKGGDAFAGHATGWTTPLRLTNRVLAGPFKTQEEARAFVNKAKSAGLSAFTFTSDAGQVVTKLATP